MFDFNEAKQYFFDGCDQLKKNNFYQAELKFKQSLSLIPNRVSTLINLTVCLIYQRKIEEAKTICLKIYNIDKDNPHVLILLGIIYAEKGYLNKALDSLEIAHKKLPNNPEIRGNLGNIYF